MAKLPTRDSLGGLPPARTGRPIANYDLSGLNSGLNATAQAYEGLAGSLARISNQLGDYASEKARYDDEIKFQQQQMREDEAFQNSTLGVDRDSLGNFTETQDKAYTDSMDSFISDKISPQNQERFRLEAAKQRRARYARSLTWQRGQEKQLSLVDIAQLADAHVNRAATYDSPSDLMESALPVLGTIFDNVHLSPAEKQEQVYTHFTNVGKAWLTAKIAAGEDISEVLDSINMGARGNEANLIAFESGGRVDVVNPLGYTGLYQHGAPRLQTVGVYTPGRGEAMKGWSKTNKNAPGKWSGEFNIPGFPEIKTHAQYRQSKGAQRKVQQMHMAKIDEEIKAQGLDRFIGQTIDGVVVTQNGMRNAAHLAGTGSWSKGSGLAGWLKSNGARNPADVNGTNISKYMALGAMSRGGASPVFAGLDAVTVAAFREKNKKNQQLAKAYKAADSVMAVQPEDPLGALKTHYESAENDMSAEEYALAEERVLKLQKLERAEFDRQQIDDTNNFHQRILTMEQDGAEQPAFDALIRELNGSDLLPEAQEALKRRILQGEVPIDSEKVKQEIATIKYRSLTEFAALDLTKYLPDLTTETFQKYHNEQLAIRNPKGRGSYTTIISTKERINTGLRNIGVKLDAKDGTADKKLSDMIFGLTDKYVRDWEEANPDQKKMSPTQIQEVVDQVFMEVAVKGYGASTWTIGDDDNLNWKELQDHFNDQGDTYGFGKGDLLQSAIRFLQNNGVLASPKNLVKWLDQYNEENKRRKVK